VAEILLCVKNRNVLDPRAIKRGDVIVVKPDGWGWSDAELGKPSRVLDENRQEKDNPNGNHPFFRVLKFSNITVNQVLNAGLLDPEQDVDPQNPSPYLQYRAKYLDYTKIPPATMQVLLDYWDDDGRAQGFIALNYTAAQVATIISTRNPVPF
jgi:hypothetical protein